MSTVKLTLNTTSIGNAIQSLLEYKALLENNALSIRSSVADYMKDFMQDQINGCVHHVYVVPNSKGQTFGNVKAVVSAENGESDSVVSAKGAKIAFVEFGAGVHFNGPAGQYAHPNPPMGQGIVPIGEYGKKNGRNDSWRLGNNWKTYGTPMQMPVQYSANYTADHIADAVKDTFTKGRAGA